MMMVRGKVRQLYRTRVEIATATPSSLVTIYLSTYREVFSKPYRIIYQFMDNKVYVLLIVDGRSDLQTLLQRRLLLV